MAKRFHATRCWMKTFDQTKLASVYPAKMFADFELPPLISFHILGQRWRNGRSYSSGKN